MALATPRVQGEIIADSAEGYVSKQGAKRGIDSVKRIAGDATVVDTWDRQ